MLRKQLCYQPLKLVPKSLGRSTENAAAGSVKLRKPFHGDGHIGDAAEVEDKGSAVTQALRLKEVENADTLWHCALPRSACRIGHPGGKFAADAADGQGIGNMLAGTWLLWTFALRESAPDKFPYTEGVIGQEFRAASPRSATRLQRAS